MPLIGYVALRQAERPVIQNVKVVGFHTAGWVVAVCAPAAEDGQGKDWSERWPLAE